jgi:hypothetical protein
VVGIGQEGEGECERLISRYFLFMGGVGQINSASVLSPLSLLLLRAPKNRLLATTLLNISRTSARQ